MKEDTSGAQQSPRTDAGRRASNRRSCNQARKSTQVEEAIRNQSQLSQFEDALHHQEQYQSIDRDLRFSWHTLFLFSPLEKAILKHPLVIIVIFAVTVARVLHAMGMLDLETYAEHAASSAVLDGVGLFLSFFVTFFLNQNVSRYYQFYFTAMLVIGRCWNIAILGNAHLGQARRFDLYRFMNMAHMSCYMAVCSKAGCADIWWEDSVLPKITECGLLSETELRNVVMTREELRDESWQDSGLRLNRVMTALALSVVRGAMQNEDLHPQTAAVLQENILQLRGYSADMSDICDRPMPVTYLSVLMKCVYFYFLFTAISASVANNLIECYIPIIFSAYQLFGLMHLARSMESPFGLELDDLPFVSYVDLVLRESTMLIDAPSHEEFAKTWHFKPRTRSSQGEKDSTNLLASLFTDSKSPFQPRIMANAVHQGDVRVERDGNPEGWASADMSSVEEDEDQEPVQPADVPARM
jgi:hypothetical protein